MSLYSLKKVKDLKLNPEKWVDLYGNNLFRYAFFRVNDRITAEDLVQEAYLSALRSIDKFEHRSTEKTWLTGILKHKIMDYHRRQIKDREIFDSGKFNHTEILFRKYNRLITDPAASNQNSEKKIVQKELISMFQVCLSELKGKTADVFMLHEIENKHTDHICDRLNISRNNYWVTLSRAKKALRHCLIKKCSA